MTSHREAIFKVYFRRPFLGAGFAGGFLGGWTEDDPWRGGTARIRHFGPEPIKSSRWAFNSASRTR